MNSHEITIYNMEDDTEMNTVQNALYEAGVIGEDRDDIGIYLQENASSRHSIFVDPSDVAKAVKVLNALGYETDEDGIQEEN
jgi:type III secretory pathway lipoprotein EscJ